MSLLLSSTAFAEVFVIDNAATTTSDVNVLDGGGSIAVTEGGSVTTREFRAYGHFASGSGNTLTSGSVISK